MKNASPVYEITLQSLVYGGEAMGRLPDGRAVFVPLALPDEQVRVRLVEEKRGHARAELLEILVPAPQRLAPRCRHFGECGGCHYQHFPYPNQLQAKADILRQQLERIGGLSHPPVQPVVGSPLEYAYRNHVEFHLAPDGRLGYHHARSEAVLPVQECLLPEEVLSQVWPQLDFEAIPGLQRVGLRLGSGDDVQLILESSDPQAPEFSVEDLPVSAVHLGPAGPLVLAGSEYVVMEILGRTFRVSAGSFFQVNTRMAEAMVRHLLENLPVTSGDTALDVYCGAGLFSAFLAERAGQVIGIEASPSSAQDFVANLDEFDHVALYEASAEETLPYLDLCPTVAVVDPPRAGLERRALEGLLKQHPRHLAYVSCDPATLGRDARRLAAGGYRLRQVTPFDLFPHTYHIESISLWEWGGER